jgi:maltooligosyltrehalose trehalohydrolase
VRELLVQNAIYWLEEFHFDGLRLDATHALVDNSPQHFLAELSERVRAALRPRSVLLIAEDDRNDARLLRPPSSGGYGLDAVWADDLHHQIRRCVAGDDEGYFADYSGTLDDIATTIERNWFFCGQALPTSGRVRGTDASHLEPEHFVVCLQNHDQIGNRAFGERLHHQVDAAVYRALSVLLLSLPQTPLLFMGQEWATASPFLFFTDHAAALGAQVRAGRRREFAAFRAFADARARETIPDPQQPETFRRSRLDWSELNDPVHAAVHRLYRSCLRLRSESASLVGTDARHAGGVVGAAAIVVARWTPTAAQLVVVNLSRAASVADAESFCRRQLPPALTWSVRLDTEDPSFVAAPEPPSISTHPWPRVQWSRPGAVVFGAILQRP